jgi:hypothetical protein
LLLENIMAKSYVVGFENVELVDGLAPDKPVWLYMRATLLNDGDPDHPLWIDEVGSLPSDANRPGFDGFPHGDAGRYADGLVVGQPVTNAGVTNYPTFSVGPVAVGPGQTLEVLVIMLPRVWLETVSVPPDDLDRLAYGVFGAGIGSIGGLPGAVVGFLFGLFAPHDQNVDVPCFNSVIMARNVFTAADLDRIETAGIERLGPQDNESYVVCHQPIDAYYSLSVNPQSFHFATTPQPHKELCTLEPRAYLPAAEQLEREWGDVGDRISDCIQVIVTMQGGRHADVIISKRTGTVYTIIGQFTRVPITRAVPHPDFRRNFYDDTCPARAVKPDCPECLRFVNLSMEMIVHPGLLYLGMLPGSHVGSQPVFPIKLNSDRVTVERRTSRSCPDETAVSKSASAFKVSGSRIAAVEAVPVRLGDRHLAQQIDDKHVRLWPTGTAPVRDNKGTRLSNDLFNDPDTYLSSELVLSWQLVCPREFTLTTYQEIKGDGGCRARLRYTRRNAQGVIVADAMLSRLPTAVR